MVKLNPTLEVEVAKPDMFKPRKVVVPKPLPAISRAEMEVVACETDVEVEM